MARAHLRSTIRDKEGRAIENARVFLYLSGTTSPLTDAFTAKSGGTLTSQLLSNNQGEIECWVDVPKLVDIFITDNSATAFIAGSASATVTWTPFREEIEVLPAPSDIAVLTDLAWDDLDRVRYVTMTGSDSNNGLSHSRSMRWVQTAIDDLASLGGGEVRVGAGTFLHEWTAATNVSVIGVGKRLTTFQAVLGSVNPGVIRLEPGQIINSRLAHFGVVGNGNANQHGIYFVAGAQASAPFDGGFWFGRLEHLFVWQFLGDAIWFRAGGNLLLPHQFILLDHLEVYAGLLGRALRLSGQCGQFNVLGGNYDGPGKGLGLENILIQREVNDAGAAISDVAPYAIDFLNVSTQSNTLGARIERAQSVNWSGCYLEELWQGISYDISAPKGSVQNTLFANVAKGDGTGYCVRSSGAATHVRTRGNIYSGTVDRSTWGDTGWIDSEGDYDSTNAYQGEGHTKQIATAATITLDYGSTFLCNPSATPISTITSSKSPGEFIFLKAHIGGTTSIASGGNIELGGRASPVVLNPGEIATLVRYDLSGVWQLVGVSV